MTARTFEATLQEKLAPYISRGSAIVVPEGAEAHYSDDTRNLMAELRALTKDRTKAQAEVRDLAGQLAAAPAAFQREAARAARAGEELPSDPIVGLERERDQTQRRVEALDAAIRAVSKELIDGLANESADATASAYEAAVPDLAKAIKAIHTATAATEKAQRLVGLSRWAAAPDGQGRIPPIGTAVADLRRAGKQLESVAPEA
jgi:chromosome segregation ATPase